MTDRYFMNADGELLFVPWQGSVLLHTELGRLEVSPGEIAVVPRGIRFGSSCWTPRPPATSARTTVPRSRCRARPDRGQRAGQRAGLPGPTAAYEDRDEPVQVVQKFGGNLWAADYDHSPLDVVGWHGNLYPTSTTWRAQ